jgi:hypothetical protein
MTMKNLCIRDAKIYKFVGVLKLVNLRAKKDLSMESFNKLLGLCSVYKVGEKFKQYKINFFIPNHMLEISTLLSMVYIYI